MGGPPLRGNYVIRTPIATPTPSSLHLFLSVTNTVLPCRTNLAMDIESLAVKNAAIGPEIRRGPNLRAVTNRLLIDVIVGGGGEYSACERDRN